MTAWLPWLLLAGAVLRTASGVPVHPEMVVATQGVRDPVFAYLIGLVEEDIYGTVDMPTLTEAVRRASGTSTLPYQQLDLMSRREEPGRPTAEVKVAFHGDLKAPIPYRILGYAPGDLRSSRVVAFREWDLGSAVIHHQHGEEVVDVRLTNIHLFGLKEGWVWVDIDGWLDRLLGGKIDDTRITGLVLFRYEGEYWGIAVGYNRDWRGRSGILSFRDNEIRYPTPPPLKTAAWKMRQILEGLEPRLRPDSLRTRGSG